MDKQQQEIMDSFINRHKGNIVTGVGSYRIQGVEFSQQQLEQRARELGWINGVKQENKVLTPYGVLKFGGQSGGMGAPDVEGWYDYENQRAIKLPPVGDVVSYKISDRMESKEMVTGHGNSGILIATMPACIDERYITWSAEKSRIKPLDHDTRKADIERKRVVDTLKHDVYLHAINRVDSISMKQSTGEDVAAAVIGYLHDKGYLRMLEDK